MEHGFTWLSSFGPYEPIATSLLVSALLVLFALAAPAWDLDAQEGLSPAQGTGAPTTAAPNTTAPATDAWTTEELENLLAPIALYPDPILAQVLIAATYPEQIAAAAAYVRLHGTEGIDEMPWELSVRAVAHYAPVLNLMADRVLFKIDLVFPPAGRASEMSGAVCIVLALDDATVEVGGQTTALARDAALRVENAHRLAYTPRTGRVAVATIRD